jgi:hypothetical protein
VNGLICKVFGLVPRHEKIVAVILNDEHSRLLTVLIGLAEVVMAVWILTRYRPKLNAIMQIGVVAAMNILEFVFVPDLLLFGRVNAVFALLFIGVIYYNEFVLSPIKPLVER